MGQEEWRVVASFGDRISAQALQGLLESADLPCQLISNGAIPGLGTEFAVLVPAPLLAQALELREQTQVPLEELTYLAIGERPGAAADPDGAAAAGPRERGGEP